MPLPAWHSYLSSVWVLGLARGYLPCETHSLHWVGNPGFARAIKDYLDAEREAVAEEIEILTEYGPFRKIEVEEQE